MIKCILLDDEPLAIQLMEDFIQKIPFLNLQATFAEPLKALDYLNKNDVDLIFLDIRMPDLQGTDFTRSLTKKPEIIFISAYSEYALQGFELKALDYLLKPVPFERFVMAANRAKEQIEAKQSRTGSKEFFFINVSHKIHKIVYDDILYLEGYKDYTKLFLKHTAAPLLVLHNLKYFEDFLIDKDFVRVHRSYIVPINKIYTVSRKTVIIGNKSIPVSDMYRDRLFSRIGH